MLGPAIEFLTMPFPADSGMLQAPCGTAVKGPALLEAGMMA